VELSACCSSCHIQRHCKCISLGSTLLLYNVHKFWPYFPTNNTQHNDTSLLTGQFESAVGIERLLWTFQSSQVLSSIAMTLKSYSGFFVFICHDSIRLTLCLRPLKHCLWTLVNSWGQLNHGTFHPVSDRPHGPDSLKLELRPWARFMMCCTVDQNW